MNTPVSNIVWADREIDQHLQQNDSDAALDMMRSYRARSDDNKGDYVAALIARVLLLHGQLRLAQ